MAAITGREIIVGLRKATTWRTAVACGVGNGVLLTDLGGMDPMIDMLKDDSLGQMYAKSMDKGAVTCEGSPGGYLRFNGWDTILALIMGACGTPVQQGSTTAYTNSITLADNIDTLFATLALLKQTDQVWEFPSVKIHGFKITGEMNAPLKITLDAIADHLVLGSSVNTTVTIAAVTYPEAGNRIIMGSNMYFRINDASGAALSSSNNVYPNKWELTFKRPMEGLPEVGQEGVSEPAQSGFAECSLTMDFPRYDAAAHPHFTDWLALTDKKIDIMFTGNIIASTYAYQFRLQSPRARFTDAKAPVGGPGRIPASVALELLACDSAPTGMTGITKPFQINVQNTRSTSPLA